MAKSNTKKQAATKLVKDKITRPERLTLKESRSVMYEKFRTNLRALCAISKLSMIDISREAGFESGKRITDLQYGRANPTMDEVMIICNYFNVAMQDLIYKQATIIFN